MPEPGHDPQWPNIRRVALVALLGGVVISIVKFALFAMSSSAAVLSDALESVINIVAAAVMLGSLSYANRPPDREHRYGHGNAQFIAIGFEGAMILFAGVGIIFEAIRRLVHPVAIRSLDWTIVALFALALLMGALGAYVYRAGRRLENDVLMADGRHLLSDLATTGGALVGLVLVRLTGVQWIDSVTAGALGLVILFVGWRLLRESFFGLMDRAEEDDLQAVHEILNAAQSSGEIVSFHKVRVRRSGDFAWVDMHLQAPAELSLREAHDIASRIEGRIERRLGGGNASAHMEPAEAD